MGNITWNKTLMLLGILLLVVVLGSCVHSELQWREESKPNPLNNLRVMVGLSSISVGTLNIAQRNPVVEMYCQSLYDMPGGYCGYYTSGVPYINSTWRIVHG